MQVQKTVFICYRRANYYNALSVYQSLSKRRYDVFFDYLSINAGAFRQIILNQIDARAQFLLLLTPTALERCINPDDIMRMEIERAITMKRNIVPLLFEGFDFDNVKNYLTSDELKLLPEYNGLPVYDAYFEDAMNRLCTRFLNEPLDIILHPIPKAQMQLIEPKLEEAKSIPVPSSDQLRNAQEKFEKGTKSVEAEDFFGAIAAYTEAISLDPRHVDAYNNRGLAYKRLGNPDQAIADYTEAIHLNPDYFIAYNNRAIARSDKGDFEGAIEDFNKAINLNPNEAAVFNNRGFTLKRKGDFPYAISDFSEAIRLDKQYAHAYYNRGRVKFDAGDYEGAIRDYIATLAIDPRSELAKIGLALACRKKEWS